MKENKQAGGLTNCQVQSEGQVKIWKGASEQEALTPYQAQSEGQVKI